MNKIIAVVSLIFIGFSASAQNQGNMYMFNGKLISTPSSSANCDNTDMAGVYEFEIANLSDNNYTAQTIAILIKCPEQYGADFFKVDGNYKMELFDNDGGTTYTIVNPAILINYNLTTNYWAGDIARY